MGIRLPRSNPRRLISEIAWESSPASTSVSGFGPQSILTEGEHWESQEGSEPGLMRCGHPEVDGFLCRADSSRRPLFFPFKTWCLFRWEVEALVTSGVLDLPWDCFRDSWAVAG